QGTASMRLAIIPARGGSKRIPRKNIKPFCGKPMIAWSIETALQSGCFDRVIVSTDDAEIAEVARQWGAEVTFMRPAELADDYTGTTPVIRHSIEWFNARGIYVNEVCCLYATAPFVRTEDIQQGLAVLNNTVIGYDLSMTNFAFPNSRAIQRTPPAAVDILHPDFRTNSSK